MIDATGFGLSYIYESEDVISEAVKSPATEEQVRKQLSKLNDTVFRLGDLQFEGYNAFVPAGMLNSARREIVGKLYEAKLIALEKEPDITVADVKPGQILEEDDAIVVMGRFNDADRFERKIMNRE